MSAAGLVSVDSLLRNAERFRKLYLGDVGYPDGSRERYAYNKLDPVSFTDRLGRRTVSVYDAVRNRIAVTDPAGHTVRYGYDADGRLKSLTDARGNTTRFERDIQGRLTARVYADGSREGYAYDTAAGRLSTRTDALGQRTAYGYARDNRLAAVDYAGALEETASLRFEDDPSFPRRVRMSDGAGTTTYQYYPAGGPGALRLAQEDGPFDEDTVSYGYDALGRVTSRQVADHSEAWAYDVLGRVIGHQNPLGTFSYAYLGDSDQVTAELLDEVPLATWRYLDNAGDRRLAAIAYPNGLGEATLRTDPYRILGIAEASRVRAYRYDAKDRLVLAVDLSRAEDQTRLAQARATRGVVYRYDAADNLLQGLTRPGQVNALNQLLRWEGQALDYDANGNLIADGRWRYRYDAENRLVAIQPQDVTRELEYRFGYDGLGRRVSESGNDSLRSLTWCGELICQLRSSGGSATYPYPQGEWQAGRRLYQERDHLGSVRAVRDLDSGTVVTRFDYGPYGTEQQRSGSLLTERGYAGMYRHAESRAVSIFTVQHDLLSH